MLPSLVTVPVPADLFIGLVTHPGTRFPGSAQETGLARALARCLASEGWECVVQVFAEDAWTSELLPIDLSTVERSIAAELTLESDWRMFQGTRMPAFLLRWFMAARRLYRHRTFLPRGVEADGSHPGVRMVRRLVNIEIAHMSLLRAAQASGATWALVLEDDASGDPAVVAGILRALSDKCSAQSHPRYVNVSRSFDEGQLGVGRNLTDAGPLAGGDAKVRILTADRPVTNTVCAVIYRGAFLGDLVPALDAIPLDPVVPIDWKLNSALMALSRTSRIGPGDCWLLTPAPIVQGSMHE